jgi:hypothetical protein
MKSIYLAGRVTGLSRYEASIWRSLATENLKEYYDILDPLSNTLCLENVESIDRDLYKTNLDNHAIFYSYLSNIDKADIILLNLLTGYSPVIFWLIGYIYSKNHYLQEPKLLYIIGDEAVQDIPFIDQRIHINMYGKLVIYNVFNSLQECVDSLIKLHKKENKLFPYDYL